MRVLLDARKLGHGGIGVYIDNLVHGLAAHGDVDLTLIVREAFDPEEYSWGKGVALISDRARPYSIDEMFGLARRIDFAGIDVFHSPHFTLPFGIRVPSVVTVHDLIHVHNPQRAFYPVVARGLVRSSLKRGAY